MNIAGRINTKMVLMASLVVCLGFIASSALIQQRVTRVMFQEEDASNRVIAGFVVQRILPHIRFRKPERVEDEFRALADQKGEDLAYAGVYLPDGTTFASVSSSPGNEVGVREQLEVLRPALLKGEMHSVAVEDHQLMLVPVRNDKDDKLLAILALRWNLQSIHQQIDSLVLAMTLIALPAVFLTILSLIAGMRMLVINPISRISTLAGELAQGEGDLRRRIQYDRQDELRPLCDSINEFIAKVHGALADVTGQSQALTQIAQQSREASDVANEAAQSQRRSLEQMAAAITEMSVSIRTVAGNACEGETTTADARQVSGEVERIIELNREYIVALAAEVDTAAGAIQRVSDDSQQIGRILDVIRGIAEQTNLLALNAAIEAARAGEQGRGFAVVADEVRSLANKTQQSTEEIKVMIDRLQAGSQAAANVMALGCQKARAGVGQTEKSRDALQRISTAVDRISAINADIARTTQEQSLTVDAIAHDVARLSDLGQASAGSAERAARVGNELFDLVNSTQNTLQRFRV